MKYVAIGILPPHLKMIEVLTVLSTGLATSRVPKARAAVAVVNLQLFFEITVALTATVDVLAAFDVWHKPKCMMNARRIATGYFFIFLFSLKKRGWM
jgi:hypothetical protein